MGFNGKFTLRFHQTWQAGKYTIYFGDFPIETLMKLVDFQPATFDDTGKLICRRWTFNCDD